MKYKQIISEDKEVLGIAYQDYFQILNNVHDEKLSNKIFNSDFKTFLADDEIPILISTNRFTDEMNEKLNDTSFDLQDKFSLSLIHHETKLNMIPYPNQSIQEWL